MMLVQHAVICDQWVVVNTYRWHVGIKSLPGLRTGIFAFKLNYVSDLTVPGGLKFPGGY